MLIISEIQVETIIYVHLFVGVCQVKGMVVVLIVNVYSLSSVYITATLSA